MPSIGIQLIVQLGVTPNTSIIGALVAMILARVPLALGDDRGDVRVAVRMADITAWRRHPYFDHALPAPE